MWNRVISRLSALAVVLSASAALASSDTASATDALNPFSPSAWKADLALWTAVVFLCLLIILWKYAWGPLAAALDARERNVADQISAAEEANRQAKMLMEEHQRKLDAAGDEVRGILDQGRRQAEQLGRELIDKAKAEADEHQRRSIQQVDAAADAALRDLADRGAQLAVELAGKIVGTKLNPADHTRLVEQTVDGFMKEGGTRD